MLVIAKRKKQRLDCVNSDSFVQGEAAVGMVTATLRSTLISVRMVAYNAKQLEPPIM
jgi:hypothetical protein